MIQLKHSELLIIKFYEHSNKLLQNLSKLITRSTQTLEGSKNKSTYDVAGWFNLKTYQMNLQSGH